MEAPIAEISTPLTRLIGYVTGSCELVTAAHSPPRSVYKQVLIVVEKQSRRPFLKRYLKRDESRRDLMQCQEFLNDALQMFTVTMSSSRQLRR